MIIFTLLILQFCRNINQLMSRLRVERFLQCIFTLCIYRQTRRINIQSGSVWITAAFGAVLCPVCVLTHSSMFLPSRPTLTYTTVRTMPAMKITPPLTRYAMGRKGFWPPNQVTVVSTISFLPLKYWTGKSGGVKERCVDKEIQHVLIWDLMVKGRRDISSQYTTCELDKILSEWVCIYIYDYYFYSLRLIWFMKQTHTCLINQSKRLHD